MLPNEIKPALEGVFPSTIVTCSLEGVPNTTIISQVWYVDPQHVAISFQFFNKTVRNIRENPHAFVKVLDPGTFQEWNLEIQYDHSESEGPIFDEMDIKLEAIASMTGLSGIFNLLAADIYKVKSVQKGTRLLDLEGAVQ
jgi:hypothetical protein